MQGYDLIGDVHGCASELELLLERLGTDPERKIIFLGDLIDRGEGQVQTLKVVRELMEQGRALCVMGNHEYNAIMRSLGLRTKHDKVHEVFLKHYPMQSSRYAEIIAWMKSLPLWLDLPELGVVHACFSRPLMSRLTGLLDERHVVLSDEFFRQSAKVEQGGDLKIYDAVETLLKGTELSLPAGCSFFDKEGNERREIRTKWWLPHPKTYHEVCLTTPLEQIPNAPIPQELWQNAVPDKPVVVGHYWLKGKVLSAPTLQESELSAGQVYCVDFSCVQGGALACLRVDIERQQAIPRSLVCVPAKRT